MYKNHLNCAQSPRFSQCRKGERRKFAQQEAVIGQERLSKQQTSPKLLPMEGGAALLERQLLPDKVAPRPQTSEPGPISLIP